MFEFLKYGWIDRLVYIPFTAIDDGDGDIPIDLLTVKREAVLLAVRSDASVSFAFDGEDYMVYVSDLVDSIRSLKVEMVLTAEDLTEDDGVATEGRGPTDFPEDGKELRGPEVSKEQESPEEKARIAALRERTEHDAMSRG